MTDNIINFFHLLATAVWIGGAVYAHVILIPALKHIDPQQSGKLQSIVAKRFSITAWSCILVLLITGLLKTPSHLLFDTSTALGSVLFAKHVVIACVIIIGLVIAFVVVPKMMRNAPKPGDRPAPDFITAQGRLKLLATVNTILGVGILLLASFLW